MLLGDPTKGMVQVVSLENTPQTGVPISERNGVFGEWPKRVGCRSDMFQMLLTLGGSECCNTQPDVAGVPVVEIGFVLDYSKDNLNPE